MRQDSTRNDSPAALLTSYRPDLADVLIESGGPGFRQAQTLEHLLRQPLRPFAEALVLPKAVREGLDKKLASTLSLQESAVSPDGTTKLLLRAEDGEAVEAVVIPHGSRATVCISSQIGCAVRCGFCATGALGLRRNLSTAEIVDQVRWASVAADQARLRMSNVVFMGMGEPLLNLGAVLAAIRLVTYSRGLNLAHRAISVSTIGIPRGIVRLAEAEPQVNLALSLHAADDETRALLVPSGHRHRISEILGAAWEHFAITHRKLLVEYLLIQGVNDSPAAAERLAKLLRGHVVTVNLLTLNCVAQDRRLPASDANQASLQVFRPSQPAAAEVFRRVLLKANVEAVMRRSRGAEIGAACGQLAGRVARSRTIAASQPADVVPQSAGYQPE